MYNASTDHSENYNTMVEVINDFNLSGEDVLNHLTDFFGLDLMSYDFIDDFIEYFND